MKRTASLGPSLKPVWNSVRRVASALVVCGAMVVSIGDSVAQSVDCARLGAQLAALTRSGGGDPARAQQFQRAAQRQQSELDRTVAYARSIGCGRRQFLFFGEAAPAQCAPLEQQISRMQVNLDQLRGQAQRAGGANDAQRRDLSARYDAYCRGAGQQQAGGRGLFDTLFGGNTREIPLEDNPEQLPPEDGGARGGSLAVCVRTCDGGFFPVSYSAGRGRSGELGELCKALCPNADTELFTMGMGREIDTAVSPDGRPYTALPNAGRYKTKYDPSCTCKPSGQTWAQALGNAEKLLGRESRRDLIVTPERAAELARAPAPRAARPDPKRGLKEQKVEEQIAAEAASGAQAPTATGESAGIAIGRTTASSNFSLADGPTREATGPDGVKRRVRIVGPQL